ncbi:MAG TPA: pseudouridine synthase, partial [Chromatiales bacterium]|nr:pseudouridine synthase [Chromatiales bacterium]
MKPSTSERLQKVLARAGLGSRRQIEGWIEEGLITVNGKTAVLGAKVTADDQIRVRGRVVKSTKLLDIARKVLIYHKPEGEVVTQHDPERRKTVFSALPKPDLGRWVAVGRLDINSSGLLLFTTDGELANRLMHPSIEIEREYAVRVLGKVNDEMLQRLRDGVELDDGLARFDSVRSAGGEGANHWYEVIIKEGRNREVRRIWESQGIKVSRLIRTRYGSVRMPRNLRSGKTQELTAAQLRELCRLVGIEDARSGHQRGN